jgi:CheY-like chemotaxis protein
MSAKRRRVLVVEDEMLIAMMIEDMLLDFGYQVLGPAMHLSAALNLAEAERIDVAVLDVNLGREERSYPVAKRLRERGIPFIFITGYGNAGLAEEFRDVTTLHKPIEPEELARTLDGIL